MIRVTRLLAQRAELAQLAVFLRDAQHPEMMRIWRPFSSPSHQRHVARVID